MSSSVIERFEGDFVTEEMIVCAAKLFSRNYGVWGPLATENMGSFAKEGVRIKMSPTKLKQELLPSKADNIHVRMKVGNDLVGSVFATRWVSNEIPMMWITQLCVSSKHRNQGIAKKLLGAICSKSEIHRVGILSSHPFAIAAVLRIFGNGINDVNLDTTRNQARTVMSSCPIRYVKTGQPRGTLFGDEANDVAVSCANTEFWVDHKEPLEALKTLKEKEIFWPLGVLPDGHEYLVLVDTLLTDR